MKRVPPATVAVAAWLLLGYGVLSLLRLWIYGSGLPSSAMGWCIWLASLAVFAAVARGLYTGRNWVRWLVTGAVVASVVVMPIYKPELPAGPQLPLYLLQFILPVLATGLMFTRSANAFFKRARSS